MQLPASNGGVTCPVGRIWWKILLRAGEDTQRLRVEIVGCVRRPFEKSPKKEGFPGLASVWTPRPATIWTSRCWMCQKPVLGGVHGREGGTYSAQLSLLDPERARPQKTNLRNQAADRTHPRSLGLRGLPGADLDARRASWKACDPLLGDEPIRTCTTAREESI